jgi:hypothetical protein
MAPPEQIEPLRDAAYDDRFGSYLTQRNEVIILLLHDTGLRVSDSSPWTSITSTEPPIRPGSIYPARSRKATRRLPIRTCPQS